MFIYVWKKDDYSRAIMDAINMHNPKYWQNKRNRQSSAITNGILGCTTTKIFSNGLKYIVHRYCHVFEIILCLVVIFKMLI